MAEISYVFKASGHGSVKDAFKSIGDAAVAYGKDIDSANAKLSKFGQQRMGGGVAREAAGGGAARRGYTEQQKLALKVAADQERASKRSARAAEQDAKRAADAAVREAKRSADAQIREDKRVARERESNSRKAARDEEKRFALQRRASEKRHQERVDSIATFGRSVYSAGAGAMLGGATLATGLVGAATRDSLRTQELSSRISINARKSGEGFMDAGKLREGFERTAVSTPGIAAADVADAVQRFISLTGNSKTAIEGQGVFATVASATGAGVGDVAEAMASLSQQFDITGLEDMREVLAALTFQGKEGAFELRDAASQFQRLAASGAAFGIPKGVQGVKTLGGLTQIARSGTGSAEQAATAVENMLTQFKAKSGQLSSKHGVDVFRDGQTRSIEDLIVETIAKVGGGDVAKKQAGLSQIFGEQGIRAINPLVSKYNDTYRTATGTEEERTGKAMEMLRGELNKSINAAGTYADVQRDAAQAQQGTSANLTLAWEKVVAQVGQEVTPALIPLIQDIPRLTSALGPAILGVSLFAKAIGGVVDYLQSTGLIDGPTRQEQFNKVKAESESFEASIDPMNMTREQIAKRKQLRARLDPFEMGGTHALWEKSGATPDFAGQDDFVAQYLATEGPTTRSKLSRENDAKYMYDEIMRNPDQARQSAEAGTGISISKEKAELVARMAEQVTAGRTVGVGQSSDTTGADASGTVEALRGVTDAAKQATEALKKIAPPPEARASTLNPGGKG